LEDKISTLEGVVAELSNDNLEVHREVSSLRERMQLLEKVFMFVDFEELQKVVDKFGKQPVEPAADISSLAQSCYAEDCRNTIAISMANFVERFPTCSSLSGTSQDEQDKVIVAVAPASGGNKEKSTRSRGKSGREDGAEAELSKDAEIRSPLSLSKDVEADPKPSMSRSGSKAHALRGAMAAKAPPVPASPKVGTEPVAKARTRHAEHASAMAIDSASAIRYPPRSKCFEFAENYRQRYGPGCALPTFIYERLGQDGMTDEEINNIGRGELRPLDDSSVS